MSFQSGNKQCGQKQHQKEIKDFIDRWNIDENSKVESYCDKNDTITRVLFLSKTYYENYKKYRDLLIIYKYQNFLLFSGIDSNANVIPFALCILANTIIDDYLWTFKYFNNDHLMPDRVIIDYDEEIATAISWQFGDCKTLFSLWSIHQYIQVKLQSLKEDTSGLVNHFMKLVCIKDRKSFEKQFEELFRPYKGNQIIEDLYRELNKNRQKFAFWYHKRLFTGGLYQEPYFDLSKTRLIQDLQKWFKHFKFQNQDQELKQAYEIMTNEIYADWVFIDIYNDPELEIRLKRGGDKFNTVLKELKK